MFCQSFFLFSCGFRCGLDFLQGLAPGFYDKKADGASICTHRNVFVHDDIMIPQSYLLKANITLITSRIMHTVPGTALPYCLGVLCVGMPAKPARINVDTSDKHWKISPRRVYMQLLTRTEARSILNYIFVCIHIHE